MYADLGPQKSHPWPEGPPWTKATAIGHPLQRSEIQNDRIFMAFPILKKVEFLYFCIFCISVFFYFCIFWISDIQEKVG